MDVWTETDAARGELADLLDGLTEEQWAAPSLCAEWTVRDVVGHLTYEVRPLSVVGGLARHGFSFDRWMASAAKSSAERPTGELVAALRALVGSRKPPPFTKPTDVLTDVTAHTQDIRRPLGLPGAPPIDRLVLIADFVRDHRFYGTTKRRAGLALRATDADWSVGEGAPVEGPLEAIVLALLGRPVACDDLSGEGVEILRARL